MKTISEVLLAALVSDAVVALLPAAERLVEHYGIWLEEFVRVRDATHPDLHTPFVFVGPQGYPFPRASANKFQQTYQQLGREVYGPTA